MTKVRARRKVKNPRSKISRRCQNNHYRKTIISHSILKEEWEQGSTIPQNYSQMGLMAGVNDGICKVSKVLAFMDPKDCSASGSRQKLEEFENDLAIGKEPTPSSETFIHLNSSETSNSSRSNNSKNTIMKLQEKVDKLAAIEKKRFMSEQECSFFADLYQKHGLNYKVTNIT